MCNFAHIRSPKGANGSNNKANGSDGAKKGPKQAQALAPRPPTLLKQLLGKELRRESSILLQTFRFLVDNSFLDAAEQEAEQEADEEVKVKVPAGEGVEAGRDRGEALQEGAEEESGDKDGGQGGACAGDGAGAVMGATEVRVGGGAEGKGAAGMEE